MATILPAVGAPKQMHFTTWLPQVSGYVNVIREARVCKLTALKTESYIFMIDPRVIMNYKF
jgi:hypothetical protein